MADNQADLRVLAEIGHLDLQFALVPQIVRIQEGHEFPGRLADARVAGSGHALVGLPQADQPRTEFRQALRRVICAAVVDHNDLRIGVRLGQHARDRLNHHLGAVVCGNDDRYSFLGSHKQSIAFCGRRTLREERPDKPARAVCNPGLAKTV